MDKDKQRIAIAEACGITPAQIAAWQSVEACRRVCEGTRRDSFSRWDAVEKLEAAQNNPNYYCDLPDYLTDLNAMHEAEKVLTEDQRAQYAMTLHTKIHGTPLATFWHRVICSTAAQRAEAFLRTVGKWQDSALSKS